MSSNSRRWGPVRRWRKELPRPVSRERATSAEAKEEEEGEGVEGEVVEGGACCLCVDEVNAESAGTTVTTECLTANDLTAAAERRRDDGGQRLLLARAEPRCRARCTRAALRIMSAAAERIEGCAHNQDHNHTNISSRCSFLSPAASSDLSLPRVPPSLLRDSSWAE